MSDNQQTDISHLNSVLNLAENNNSYSTIYALWAIMIFSGYLLADIQLDWVNTYWLIAAPTGMALSAWLGYQKSKSRGQVEKKNERLFMKHFAILLLFIFIAVVSGQESSILLIISLTYCLAGIHLERPMLWVGIFTLAAYLATHYHLINSNLVLGTVLAAGFLVCAWCTSQLGKSE